MFNRVKIRKVAQIIAKLNSQKSKETLEIIEKRDFDLAKLLRENIFIFEDIKNLSDKSIREILKTIDKKELILALKGEKELQNKFFLNISNRTKEYFIEEIQLLGKVKKSQVLLAQKRVIETVKKLFDEGLIENNDELIK